MTTKLPLTDDRLSTISDYFVAMEEHYSDPADRENFEIFSDAKAFLAELQQRRKAATGREPVGIKLPPKMSNDRTNAHELSTGVDVWNRCIDEVAKLNGKCIPSVPSGLHPDTQKLVTNFCTALAEKLYKAQLKYGHSDNWSYANWEIECQTAFHEHIAKGDPRDVAAYCAFMWYHGWRTEVERREQVVPDEVEHVAAVLELIGGFEAADIDSDTVDLRFEIDDVDTGSDVSITEYAARAAAIIRMLAGNVLVIPDGCNMEALENTQTENELRTVTSAANEPYGFTDGDRRGMIYKPEHADRLNEPLPVYRNVQQAPVVPDALIKAVDFYEQVKRENPSVETGAWKDAVEWVLKEACLAAKKDES
ncbi:Uncharacterised protein [Klebsiella quasipneumoniae]|uniref:hypothetical protein n=1 Tax=Klebsiella quasipneumoniae TaxID=1463165 RepID=UPI000A0F2775|nr:Uncharacterised protein [Klebsiella quasipneumoniae]